MGLVHPCSDHKLLCMYVRSVGRIPDLVLEMAIVPLLLFRNLFQYPMLRPNG